MTETSLSAELVRRQKVASATWTLFQARSSRWLHWKRFARLAPCAWRSRISDARKEAKAQGGTIEWNRSITRSAYRYLPYEPLGRDASIPAPDAWPITGAPYHEPFKLTPPEV